MINPFIRGEDDTNYRVVFLYSIVLSPIGIAGSQVVVLLIVTLLFLIT